MCRGCKSVVRSHYSRVGVAALDLGDLDVEHPAAEVAVEGERDLAHVPAVLANVHVH